MAVIQIQHRYDTAANWTAANPVLLAGEFGLDTTSVRVKLGDGTTAWNSLSYQHTRMLSGTGAPGAGLGVDGDFYINTAIPWLYGPKAAGAWGAGITMVGPQGTTGSTGSAGPGVPTAGTGGQYLRKTTATNYDTAWAGIASSEVSGLGTLAGVSNLTGPITSTGAATAVTADAITNTMLANMVANTLKGTVAGGDPADLTPTQVTAMMNGATTVLQGMMSALDKRMVDNLHYDFVADFGGVGNDSTLNDTAIATAMSTMPAGAVLFFPAGTYRFANVIDINVDKRFTFKGVNRYASIIKTTSATANIFHKTVAGWYDMWTDLGFQSSVTRTGGSAIAVTPGNNVGMNVYRCWFTGMFNAINYDGNQSGNLSVLSDLDISAIANGGRGIRVNGGTINVMIHNVTINGGAATTSACLEIVASGAVQVTNCDWIQGTNVVLFNATAALGAQAVYFTNCFFDQPQGHVVLVTGTFTHGRIKLTQCGIATATSGFNAVYVNGTGAGGVGTSSALPAGISIVDCDIYHAAGGSTGAGVYINGCQDVNIQNNRVTGYSGAGGAGIRVTPSAGGVTKVRCNGNIVGPNSNLTVFNTTGVQIDAGTIGALSVTDNTLIGNTTPLTNASTMTTGQLANINNNTGHPVGFNSRATHGATVLTTVDTVVMSLPIAANSLNVGMTFLIDYIDTSALTNSPTVRFRIGTAGTTADAGVLAMTAVATATSLSGRWILTCTAVGAGTATFFAGGIGNGTPTAGTALSVAFSSTVANFLTMSIASGASTTRTVRGGQILCSSM